MTDITLHHSAEVLANFPNHATAALRLRATGLQHHAAQLLTTEVDSTVGPLTHPAIAVWRDVYASMGAKPKYLSSLANLVEGVEAQGCIPSINPLVDLYNTYSLVHGVAMAGYDAGGLEGALRLVVFDKTLREMPFTPLGKPRDQPQHLRTGEVAYIDDAKVVCRYWNWRDCDQTKLTNDTEDALIVFDLVDLPGSDAAQQYDDAVSTFRSWFGEALVASAWSRSSNGDLDLGPRP